MISSGVQRVLVTGAYGYLGGRVAQTLAQDGKRAVLLGTRGNATAPPAWLPAAQPLTLDWRSAAALQLACNAAAWTPSCIWPR